MSLFSFLNTQRKELSILLDVGNGSINGGLALFEKGKTPKILYTVKLPFSIKLDVTGTGLLNEMVLLLDKIIPFVMKKYNSLSKDERLPISRVLMTFSSPWFALKAKEISLNQEKAFVITRSFLDDVISKEEKIFEEELSVKEGKKKIYEIVEKSIIHAKINGYPITQPLGKRTKNLTAYLCFSVIPKSILDQVKSILNKNIHINSDKVLVHTFPIASFISIRDVFLAGSSFVIIDVTGEVTDLTLVKDDIVVESISIPSGRNFLIRQIAKKFDVSIEIAESQLGLYSISKLEAEIFNKLDDIIVDVEKEWSIYLENALQELAQKESLPATVYMTCDPDVAELYRKFLTLPKLDSTAEFRKNINLIHIGNESLVKSCETVAGVKPSEFLSILAIFYNKIFEHS